MKSLKHTYSRQDDNDYFIMPAVKEWSADGVNGHDLTAAFWTATGVSLLTLFLPASFALYRYMSDDMTTEAMSSWKDDVATPKLAVICRRSLNR